MKNRTMRLITFSEQISKKLEKEKIKTLVPMSRIIEKALKQYWNNEDDIYSMSAGEIYGAGKDYEYFDYDEGLNILIQQDKTGEWIYLAGLDWPQFDYEKGFRILKKFPEYRAKAWKEWPTLVNKKDKEGK